MLAVEIGVLEYKILKKSHRNGYHEVRDLDDVWLNCVPQEDILKS